MPYYSATFPGSRESIHEARAWTQHVLGEALGVDDVVLVASELVTNAIRHTTSGLPGGTFTVHLAAFTNRWRVRVDDAGGPTEPRVQIVDDDEDEVGRGLVMVASLSSAWGVLGARHARGVWAEIRAPPGNVTDDCGIGARAVVLSETGRK
ncbi:ATP-binding protein [Catenulispora sp. NF23]|uniref:ATP-binding protein n=1 Tax=Catenulispora pinistramenti TaxID=2705254 RepID=A0ABS5KR56_9ACTN|nr:ATP-binding protein [Catenulispora pinistramenti]MBS2533134.1 ATP-binding protein [Catenulispora pinistramenti]MBS2548536.1 ATP-binding protein [Catenulispora pinistramenti]